MSAELKGCVTWFMYFLDPPHPWVAPKRPIVNSVKACGIIRISKIEFFNFSISESVKIIFHSALNRDLCRAKKHFQEFKQIFTMFHHKETTLTKFSEKRCFWSKTEKVNISIEFCIFKLDFVPDFSLYKQFWFFQIYPKRVFLV